MPYFASLDGVRAYCIFLVIYNHLKLGKYSTQWVNGHLGVDLFFILSGFLITTLLSREWALTGGLDLGAFYWRRLFRIAPVYFVVLGLYVVVTPSAWRAGALGTTACRASMVFDDDE